MKTRHFSKVRYAFQRTCSCLLDTKKNTRFLSFALIGLLTQTCLHFCRTGQLTSEHAKSTYIMLLLHLFASLCPHTVFYAAKFSIKVFIDILTVSVVRQGNEYE